MSNQAALLQAIQWGFAPTAWFIAWTSAREADRDVDALIKQLLEQHRGSATHTSACLQRRTWMATGEGTAHPTPSQLAGTGS